MALKRAGGGQGNWLKTKDHLGELVLVEATNSEEDVPRTYKGKTSYKRVATADWTFFADKAALEAGEPSEIVLAAKVDGKALAADVGDAVGDQLVGRLLEVSMGEGSGYVLRSNAENLSDAEFEAISNYVEKRDAALTEAAADAPGFDD